MNHWECWQGMQKLERGGKELAYTMKLNIKQREEKMGKKRTRLFEIENGDNFKNFGDYVG